MRPLVLVSRALFLETLVPDIPCFLFVLVWLVLVPLVLVSLALFLETVVPDLPCFRCVGMRFVLVPLRFESWGSLPFWAALWIRSWTENVLGAAVPSMFWMLGFKNAIYESI